MNGGWLHRPRKLNPKLAVRKAKKQQPDFMAETPQGSGISGTRWGWKRRLVLICRSLICRLLDPFFNLSRRLHVYFLVQVKEGFWIGGARYNWGLGYSLIIVGKLDLSLHTDWEIPTLFFSLTTARILVARIIPLRQESGRPFSLGKWPAWEGGPHKWTQEDHQTGKPIDHMLKPSAKSFWSSF